MLKIYFLFYLLFISCFTEGQILDPAIINTAGGNIQIISKTNQVNNNWILDWTLCEPFAVQTWCSKNKIIFSTGFLQPSLMLNPAFNSPESFDFNLIWGPNPVMNYVELSCKQAGVEIMNIQVIDHNGNKIQNIKGPFSGLHFSKQISFASANTGIYFIAIHYIVGGKFSQMKIIKIIKI